MGKYDCTDLIVASLHPNRTNNYHADFVEHLFRRGLILAIDSYNQDVIREGCDNGGMLSSDERILAQVGFPECLPWEILPMPVPDEIYFRYWMQGSTKSPDDDGQRWRRPACRYKPARQSDQGVG